MDNTKENHNRTTKTDYFRYLYQEVLRKGTHKNPNFYQELIKFIESPLGKQALKKFKKINPHSIGIQISCKLITK